MNEGPRAVRCQRVVTCDPARASAGDPLGSIADGAVVFDETTIRSVGPASDVPREVPVLDLGARVLTPGLVDAHTHAAWAGSRHAEYAVRMAGGDYEAILAAGGGILSSHRAIVQTAQGALADTLALRLTRMAALGVTTCEVKSGYGLLPHEELKQLRAIAAVTSRPGVPSVVPTLLALHALPLDARANREAYVRKAAEQLVPEVARARLAAYVDAYVDRNAFTVEEARRVGEAARAAGLGVRLHVGQFADVGGAELAAELGAASADHLENVSEVGIAALADARVHAVLLPIASLTLQQAPPPVAALRAAGVRLVVASDANPGTAPTESLPLALAIAVRLYGLTPDEAILGSTRVAASSLGLDDRGFLAPGQRADMVAWDLPHEHAIVQPWGTSRTSRVWCAGALVHSSG